MDFNEKIGDYRVVRHGEIIVYTNESINIEIQEDTTMILRVLFITEMENNRKSHILIQGDPNDNNLLVVKFVNIHKDYSVSGIFEPIEIGIFDNGDKIYFTCAVFTVNAKDGNRIFKYSFLTK